MGEVMITMVLLGMGMLAAFFFYSSTVGRTADSEARVSTIAEVRNVGERMARDARESAAICPSQPAGATNVLYVSGPPDDPIGAATCEASRQITYDCETTPGTCTRAEGSTATEVVIEGLDTSTPVFSPSGPNYVSITLSKLPDGRSGPITIERGATLRSYCEAGC